MPNKKLLTLLLCFVLTAAAQRYDRRSFKFRSSLVKNDKGELTHVKVMAYVAGKVVQEFKTELPGVPEETSIDGIGKLSQYDLNGDGIADVVIDLGYYGHGPNDHYDDALIWMPKLCRFRLAEGYKDLQGPMYDEEQGLLYTVGRYGPNEMSTSYYQWNGHRVEFLRSEVWFIDDDEEDDDGRDSDDDDDFLKGYTHYAATTIDKMPTLVMKRDTDNHLLVMGQERDGEARVLLESEYDGEYSITFYQYGAELYVDTGEYNYDHQWVVIDGRAVVHRYEEGATGTGGAATGYCKLDGEDNYNVTEEILNKWLGKKVDVTLKWEQYDGNQYKLLKLYDNDD